MNFIKNIKVLAEADVVVVGGGVSGVVAAIASAQNGADTLLVEKYGFLGGTATAALVAPMSPFHSKRGEQVIGGIPQKIIDRLSLLGGGVGHVIDTIGVVGSVTPYDPEFLKVVLQKLTLESGAKLLYHTWLSDVIMNEDRINSLVVSNKDGLTAVRGKVYIDATGDGDVSARAGIPYEIGDENGEKNCQPMTLIFKLGGVSIKDLIDYCLCNRGEFHSTTLFEELQNAPIIGLSGFFSLWKKAIAKGDVAIPRDRILLFTTLREGEVIVNTTRVSAKSGINTLELTQAELEGREQMFALVSFFKEYIPGFKQSYLLQSASQIGVRETRRITGEYKLSKDDVINGRSFSDCVAKGAWPIDIHDPKGSGVIMNGIKDGGSYDIPYRSLCPKNIKNLLLAGRCISASHEAFASSRVMPTSMAVGEAAGTAGALAVSCNGDMTKIDIDELRSCLLKQGAII